MIISKLKTPVESVTETKDGHLVVRFDNKKNLEEAKEELNGNATEKIKVEEKGKMKPKIKIVNVPKDDDDIINSIKCKNHWIADLIENEEDLTIKKEEESRNEKKKHYIIKCSPKIRKAIYDHGDKLRTMYEHCNVYDTYQPYQCYKCQEFGHSATKCQNNQVCPKCGENHKYKECKSTEMKCKNCVTRKMMNTNHKAFDVNACTIYKEEIARIKNNTDHGFD